MSCCTPHPEPSAADVLQVAHPQRREALASGLRSILALSVASALPAGFTRQARATSFPNDPGEAESVTLGFNIPQSGAHAEEGADQLRAGRLAVKHLNGEGDGGMLATLRPSALSGQGILGKRVEYVIGDTQTGPDADLKSTRRLIEQGGAIMITGGSTSAEAITMQQLCHEAGVIFMAGVAHANAVTGRDRRANGFRHFHNAYQSAAAMLPVLARRHGNQRTVFHLSADNRWGRALEASMQGAIDAAGWQTAGRLMTPVSADDFSAYPGTVMDSGADTLILNLYDRDITRALTAMSEAGLRERPANGRELIVVVPLYSSHLAKAAGDAYAGVYGTANWHWSLEDAGSQAFVASFGTEYGFAPSQAAHVAYAQTLLYADACERAGTFAPCQVSAALEGHRFAGLGNGSAVYRSEDHQCFKDVLVVRGRDGQAADGDSLEIVEVVPAAQISYPSEHPMFAGSAFAECNDGETQ